MTKRTIKVRAYARVVAERLDTPAHRKLAAEVGFVPRKWQKPRIRVPARRGEA